MYEALENADTALAALTVLAWLLAGHRAGRIAFRPADRRRRTARVALALIVIGALVVAARLAVITAMVPGAGWDFAAGQVLVGVPVLLAGVLPALLVGGPGLWGDPDRARAADPGPVAAIQAGAVAAVLAFWVELVTRPVAPYVGDLAFFLGLLGLGTAALLVRQRRRHRIASPARPARRVLSAVATTVVLLALAVGGLITASRTSVLPDSYAMMGAGMPMGGVDVTSLTGDVAGVRDRRFTLTAAPTTTRLASGASVEGWAFNGSLPGPQLRVRQGELVEVTLVNQLPATGVTLHWHGVDVANAADGVAGLTQNAVPPGGRYVYRFRAPDVGTYWYHSHQQSSDAVARGLFGSIVVLPLGAVLDQAPGERTLLAHTWEDTDGRRHPSFGTGDGLVRERLAAGTPVRLRVVNTDNAPLAMGVAGTGFHVAAVDGGEVHAPGELRDRTVRIGSGGRVDVAFTMPDHPVVLARVGTRSAAELDHAGRGDAGPGLMLSPDGTGDAPPLVAGPDVDLLTYGTAAPTPFDARTPTDRDISMILDERPGFYDGSFGFLSTIDGASFPDTPMPMVREGDLVRVTFVNRSHSTHPMHLHGHHALVLSRDGAPATGSPWWVDTLDVEPGQTFEVAFRADNPGLWMDHCHNLEHAAHGMTMHLGYEGVTSSFLAGHGTSNQPE